MCAYASARGYVCALQCHNWHCTAWMCSENIWQAVDMLATKGIRFLYAAATIENVRGEQRRNERPERIDRFTNCQCCTNRIISMNFRLFIVVCLPDLCTGDYRFIVPYLIHTQSMSIMSYVSVANLSVFVYCQWHIVEAGLCCERTTPIEKCHKQSEEREEEKKGLEIPFNLKNRFLWPANSNRIEHKRSPTHSMFYCYELKWNWNW